MASLTITGWDDMITKLTKLSKKPYLDDVAKKAVNAAKDTVASSMRSSLSGAEGHRGKSKDRTTGAVSASVIAIDAKVNSYGVYSVAMPTGRHPSGTSNGKMAALLEYGGHNLEARPWRASAAGMAEGPATQIIQSILDAELELD